MNDMKKDEVIYEQLLTAVSVSNPRLSVRQSVTRRHIASSCLCHPVTSQHLKLIINLITPTLNSIFAEHCSDCLQICY